MKNLRLIKSVHTYYHRLIKGTSKGNVKELLITTIFGKLYKSPVHLQEKTIFGQFIKEVTINPRDGKTI